MQRQVKSQKAKGKSDEGYSTGPGRVPLDGNSMFRQTATGFALLLSPRMKIQKAC